MGCPTMEAPLSNLVTIEPYRRTTSISRARCVEIRMKSRSRNFAGVVTMGTRAGEPRRQLPGALAHDSVRSPATRARCRLLRNAAGDRSAARGYYYAGTLPRNLTRLVRSALCCSHQRPRNRPLCGGPELVGSWRRHDKPRIPKGHR